MAVSRGNICAGMVVTESQQIAIRRAALLSSRTAHRRCALRKNKNRCEKIVVWRAALLSSRTGTNNKSARQETSPPRDDEKKKQQIGGRFSEPPKRKSAHQEMRPPKDAKKKKDGTSEGCSSEGGSPNRRIKRRIRRCALRGTPKRWRIKDAPSKPCIGGVI